VTVHHSVDGATWTKYGVQFEVSGYHQNVAGDFLSLRPAIQVRAKCASKTFVTRPFEALL
jgi:hypothetical protein